MDQIVNDIGQSSTFDNFFRFEINYCNSKLPRYKTEGVENSVIIVHFLTAVKFRGGIGQMSERILQL